MGEVGVHKIFHGASITVVGWHSCGRCRGIFDGTWVMTITLIL